ncbi:MAG TPA: hypothetical protein VHU83_10695 [Bryobacteraceae bacterium]|jgi:hypothetical protein|nr:hypothetical protein [Bryobacteraceae bacterium]
MPVYRIHRIKETPAENFRWAAHTGGLAVVKPKDYDEGAEEMEAVTPYAAWKALGKSERPLRPGDLLETITPETGEGDLQIVKYIGFEPAKWYAPETPSDTGTNVAERAASAIPATSAHPI